MSSEDLSQIIDRLARMEEKQDRQGEQISDLRVAITKVTIARDTESGGKKLRLDAVAAYSAFALVAVELGFRLLGGK